MLSFSFLPPFLMGKWENDAKKAEKLKEAVNQRPKFRRPFGKIYQAINADTLRAQNMETWLYFNQDSCSMGASLNLLSC
ncbi:hypothetical protein PAHAL_4G146400 [Panicum hallii]|uniref:Uncharacterized protein n=2 Tax=Panicum hallii TaxID=206008 RepID=A0A2T8JCX1_9POAL|nr:hypothetical protein PAHAL_4G146400 [Panicum hallii]